jgi:hypothetical protein
MVGVGEATVKTRMFCARKKLAELVAVAKAVGACFSRRSLIDWGAQPIAARKSQFPAGPQLQELHERSCSRGF